jgi:hypothetical protein
VLSIIAVRMSKNVGDDSSNTNSHSQRIFCVQSFALAGASDNGPPYELDDITVRKDDLQLRIAGCGHRSRPKLNPSPSVAPLDRDEIELRGFADRQRFAQGLDAKVNCRGGTRGL